MSKIKILLGFGLLITIFIIILSTTPLFKTQSLDEILGFSVDEISSSFVIDVKNKQINFIDEADDLIKLQEILERMRVKRVWKHSYGTAYNLSVSTYYHHIMISISNNGVIFPTDDLSKGYRIIEDELFEDLLVLLEQK